MINKKLLIAVGATAITAGMYSSTLTAASVIANAAANVITPLSISETNGMDFGDVSVGTGGGTVVLVITGGRTVSGDAEAVTGGGEILGAYSVSGDGNKAYGISFPASATISSGGNNMTVDTFTHNAGGSPALSTGSDAFNVGATLNIGGSQVVGAYAGTYTLTVNYQ